MNDLRQELIAKGRIVPAHPDGIMPYVRGNPMTTDQLRRAGYEHAAAARDWENMALMNWEFAGRRTARPRR